MLNVQLVMFVSGSVFLSESFGMQVEKTIGNRYDSLKVDYSKEHNPLGTAGALKLVQQNTDTEHFLVMNGDSYVEFNLFSLLTYSRKNKANIVILTKKVEDTSRYGTIKFCFTKVCRPMGTRHGHVWIMAKTYKEYEGLRSVKS